MIYLDSSVVLAFVFAEDRAPAESFWSANFVSSELLRYEVWTRVHSRNTHSLQALTAREMLNGVELIAMTRARLARALEPFPLPVRTLDGLHLATMDYLRNQGAAVEIATYDRRLSEAAAALGFAAVAI